MNTPAFPDKLDDTITFVNACQERGYVTAFQVFLSIRKVGRMTSTETVVQAQ